MSFLKYILEPYSGISSRFTCPKCHKKKSFVRYIDIEKNEYLPDSFGKCNRDIKCGYWLDPYKEKIWENEQIEVYREKIQIPVKLPSKREDRPESHIDFNLVLSTVRNFDENNFLIYLKSRFGEKFTNNAIKNYFIGTSKHWNKIGATIFWQVDFYGNVRSGKIMAYNSKTGKRIKEPFNHITWVHKLLNIEGYNLSQCYFGEHLLSVHKNKPVAIVESEKTAIISSFYFPQFVWIASGSLNNISINRSESLLGRNILLVPDLSENGKSLELWNQKAEELSELTSNIRIFDLLEKISTIEERRKGLDIADFLVKYPLDYFLESNTKINYLTFEEYISGLKFQNGVLLNQEKYPAIWDTVSSFSGIDSRTKDFINLAVKNPNMLSLQRLFELTLSRS